MHQLQAKKSCPISRFLAAPASMAKGDQLQTGRHTITAANVLALDKDLWHCPAATLVHKKVQDVLTLLCMCVLVSTAAAQDSSALKVRAYLFGQAQRP